MGKCGAGIVFAQQGKRAPDHGGTGVDRETYPRSLVGSGVYDSRVVPVVGAVGSDLGGCGLVGLGRVAITRLITRPMRSRYQRAASWRAGRQRKEQSGSPGPRLNEESPSWQKLALTACLGRKHRKARACAPTPWWSERDSNSRSPSSRSAACRGWRTLISGVRLDPGSRATTLVVFRCEIRFGIFGCELLMDL